MRCFRPAIGCGVPEPAQKRPVALLCGYYGEHNLGDDALLGELGRGFHIMMSVLEKGRVGIAALAIGIAQAGLDAALDYAKTRRQFGGPIIDNQGLQWMLADMAKEIAAAAHRAWWREFWSRSRVVLLPKQR